MTSIDPTTLKGNASVRQGLAIRNLLRVDIRPIMDSPKPLSKAAASKIIAAAKDKNEKATAAHRAALLKVGGVDVPKAAPKAKATTKKATTKRAVGQMTSADIPPKSAPVPADRDELADRVTAMEANLAAILAAVSGK